MSAAASCAALMSAGPHGIDAFTKLMLHGDGVDATTTFTDSSLVPHTFTANGNAQIDTAQSKFGGASMLFDGTGDYLLGDGSADFAFGTGDFTIDFWIRPNSLAVRGFIYDGRPAATNGAYASIFLETDGTVNYFVNSAVRITSAALSTATWYHFAIARTGTTTKMFKDGTQTGSSFADSTTYIVGASRPTIGIFQDLSTLAFNGWLDEFRVSTGIARWTTTFVPEARAYAW